MNGAGFVDPPAPGSAAARSGPVTAFAHIGNGTNMIYVDREHDLVAVVRWIDGRAIDGFLKRLLASAQST